MLLLGLLRLHLRRDVIHKANIIIRIIRGYLSLSAVAYYVFDRLDDTRLHLWHSLYRWCCLLLLLLQRRRRAHAGGNANGTTELHVGHFFNVMLTTLPEDGRQGKP